jgi:hypothetical protein
MDMQTSCFMSYKGRKPVKQAFQGRSIALRCDNPKQVTCALRVFLMFEAFANLLLLAFYDDKVGAC